MPMLMIEMVMTTTPTMTEQQDPTREGLSVASRDVDANC